VESYFLAALGLRRTNDRTNALMETLMSIQSSGTQSGVQHFVVPDDSSGTGGGKGWMSLVKSAAQMLSSELDGGPPRPFSLPQRTRSGTMSAEARAIVKDLPEDHLHFMLSPVLVVPMS